MTRRELFLMPLAAALAVKGGDAAGIKIPSGRTARDPTAWYVLLCDQEGSPIRGGEAELVTIDGETGVLDALDQTLTPESGQAIHKILLVSDKALGFPFAKELFERTEWLPMATDGGPITLCWDNGPSKVMRESLA